MGWRAERIILETSSHEAKRVVLQPRDQCLLAALPSLRLVDVAQAKVVCGFQSVSRAKTRLLALFRAGHLDRFFVGTIKGGRKTIYCLPKSRKARAARPITSAQTERFADHQLLINDIYLRLADSVQPSLCRWERYTKPLLGSRGVIPDALAQVRDGKHIESCLLEIDLGTESSTVWGKKVSAYLELARSGWCEKALGTPAFRVLVIARGEDRIRALQRVIARSTDRIFWLASIESINRDGFWSSVWLRPIGDAKLSLLS